MDSIIQKDKTRCLICGKNGGYWGLDRHHVFGASNRNKSEQYGLVVWLCHDECHLNGVHKKGWVDRAVKKIAQQKAMEHYGWSTEEFIKIFRKNYI